MLPWLLHFQWVVCMANEIFSNTYSFCSPRDIHTTKMLARLLFITVRFPCFTYQTAPLCTVGQPWLSEWKYHIPSLATVCLLYCFRCSYALLLALYFIELILRLVALLHRYNAPITDLMSLWLSWTNVCPSAPPFPCPSHLLHWILSLICWLDRCFLQLITLHLGCKAHFIDQPIPFLRSKTFLAGRVAVDFLICWLCSCLNIFIDWINQSIGWTSWASGKLLCSLRFLPSGTRSACYLIIPIAGLFDFWFSIGIYCPSL